MSTKRLTETERMKMIIKFIKEGTQPEGYHVREDGYGGYRVTAVKVKDPEAERAKKRAKLIKKLIEIDPTLTHHFSEEIAEATPLPIEEVNTADEVPI